MIVGNVINNFQGCIDLILWRSRLIYDKICLSFDLLMNLGKFTCKII